MRVYVAAGSDGRVAEAAGGVLLPTALTGGSVSAVAVAGERMPRRLASEAAKTFGAPTSVVGEVALADATAVEVVSTVMCNVECRDHLVDFAPLGGEAGQFEVHPPVDAAANSRVDAATAAVAAAAAVGGDFIREDDELSSPTWVAAAAVASASVVAATAAPGDAFWDGPAGVAIIANYAFDDDEVGLHSPF